MSYFIDKTLTTPGAPPVDTTMRIEPLVGFPFDEGCCRSAARWIVLVMLTEAGPPQVWPLDSRFESKPYARETRQKTGAPCGGSEPETIAVATMTLRGFSLDQERFIAKLVSASDPYVSSNPDALLDYNETIHRHHAPHTRGNAFAREGCAYHNRACADCKVSWYAPPRSGPVVAYAFQEATRLIGTDAVPADAWVQRGDAYVADNTRTPSETLRAIREVLPEVEAINERRYGASRPMLRIVTITTEPL